MRDWALIKKINFDIIPRPNQEVNSSFCDFYFRFYIFDREKNHWGRNTKIGKTCDNMNIFYKFPNNTIVILIFFEMTPYKTSMVN